jgi:hypothetical protein
MAGFRLNLKLVLYLQSQCLTERLGFIYPPLLQAAKRWHQAPSKYGKTNIIKTILTIFSLYKND